MLERLITRSLVLESVFSVCALSVRSHDCVFEQRKFQKS